LALQSAASCLPSNVDVAEVQMHLMALVHGFFLFILKVILVVIACWHFLIPGPSSPQVIKSHSPSCIPKPGMLDEPGLVPQSESVIKLPVQRKGGAEIPLMEVELAHLDPSEFVFFSMTLTSAELDIATLTALNKWKGETK
jgi:hypothetical protein